MHHPALLASRRDALKVAIGVALGAAPARALAEGKAPRVVDSHVHVWKNDPRYPWPKGLKGPKEDALPSTLLRLMNANGIDRTVIVHVIYYRWDCRYAADVIKAHPDRFSGVCRVDPTAPGAADDLTRWVRARGFRG